LMFSGDATTPVTGLPLEELRDLEDRLRAALGTKVELVGDGERGRIVIAYYSGEELDGLLARLEGRPAEGVGEEEGSEATAEEDATPAPRRPRRGSGQMIGGLLSSRLG